MTLLARSSGLKLLENAAATGDWQVWFGGISFLDIFAPAVGGNWGGATAVLEQSPDDGVTAITHTVSFTADGSVDSIVIPFGRKVHVKITGGTAVVLSATLSLQDKIS